MLKIKRGVMTRSIKSLEQYLVNEFDQQILLKSYEKTTAAKSELDDLIGQLSLQQDISADLLAEELNTHEGYVLNFEKIDEKYQTHMNKIFK